MTETRPTYAAGIVATYNVTVIYQVSMASSPIEHAELKLEIESPNAVAACEQALKTVKAMVGRCVVTNLRVTVSLAL